MSIKVGIFLLLTYAFAIWNMSKNDGQHVRVHLIISFVFFLMAYGAWYMDKTRTFPLKKWGHGLWHLFTAAAISVLFYGIALIS
jgi:hypothetical protein